MSDNNQFDDVYLLINNQIFPITKPIISIGRKLDNDLVIQDPLVSRLHAQIYAEEGKFLIRDKGSTGGTFVNNKKVDEAVLFSGDIILLANIPLMFINDNPSIYKRSEIETDSLDKTDKN
jgi:pSer/pThr/pTyr-binding forkhead associated (FHA) protein